MPSKNTAVPRLSKATYRSLRGSFFLNTDSRFVIIAVLSVTVHCTLLTYIRTVKIQKAEVRHIENIPKRIVKFIVEKPLPPHKSGDRAAKAFTPSDRQKPGGSPPSTPPHHSFEAKTPDTRQAKRAVAIRASKIGRRMRNTGILAVLTGKGTTAGGPAVFDVLTGTGTKKEHFVDLERMLQQMQGLQSIKDIAPLNRVLTKSKDVNTPRTDAADIGTAASAGLPRTAVFEKRGTIELSRPEAIEGIASSNVNRDRDAISRIVHLYKTSIRMSYEKYLHRIPDLEGKITVRFTILANGNVVDAVIVHNTTGSRELEKEILQKVRTWRFDSIEEGDVTVTYPLLFKSS